MWREEGVHLEGPGGSGGAPGPPGHAVPHLCKVQVESGGGGESAGSGAGFRVGDGGARAGGGGGAGDLEDADCAEVHGELHLLHGGRVQVRVKELTSTCTFTTCILSYAPAMSPSLAFSPSSACIITMIFMRTYMTKVIIVSIVMVMISHL